VRFIGTSVQAPADSHTAPITSLEWSPDGQFLASGSYDGSVLIWERNGWRAKHRLFHPRLVNGVRWSPNGTWLATSCADGHCRVWNSESGIETHVLSRHTDDVNSVAWSPTRITSSLSRMMVRAAFGVLHPRSYSGRFLPTRMIVCRSTGNLPAP